MKGTRFTRVSPRPVTGNINGSRVTVAVGFSPNQFEVLRDMARENGLSFAEQVRQIVDKMIAPPQESADDDRLMSIETEMKCRKMFQDVEICSRVVRGLREMWHAPDTE